MPILRDSVCLNLEACVHMEIFTMVGNQIWVNHHGPALFPLPDIPHTTVTNEANCSYNNDIDDEGNAEDAAADLHPRDEAPGPRPPLLHASVTPDEVEPSNPPAPRTFPSTSSYLTSLLAST